MCVLLQLALTNVGIKKLKTLNTSALDKIRKINRMQVSSSLHGGRWGGEQQSLNVI